MSVAEGSQIGSYVLEQSLWRDALGTIYQARHHLTGDTVSILLLDESVNEQIPIKRQFIQATRSAERLDHPSILALHESNRSNGRFYAILSFVEGVNLGSILDKIPPGHTVQLEEALLLMAQVAEALAHAHQHNVVHRALSPWSIIVKRQPQAAGFPLRAVVTDFGYGRLQHSLIDIDTEQLLRLLPFFSPEQTLAQTTDHRSDLFAVGVMLYRMLTGALPFLVEAPSDAVLRHLKQTPLPPQQHQRDIPDVVQEIIHKALEKKPDKRYQSGSRLAAALRNAVLTLANQPTAVLRDNIVSVRSHLPAVEIARLFIFGQNETARIIPLDKRSLIVGRSRTSDIRLSDEGVSRHHIRIEQAEDGWMLVDLNSTNGTFLNKERITPQVAHFWSQGQKVEIGTHVLTWQ